MGQQKFKGIRSDEILDCGCKLKRYISGLNVIDSEDKSSECENSKHHNFKEYQCRSCAQFFNTRIELKKHRWSHAI